MKELTHTLILEEKYDGNVLTNKLPQELDNGLYALIHFVGGMEFRDVIHFADNATEEEIIDLNFLEKHQSTNT